MAHDPFVDPFAAMSIDSFVTYETDRTTMDVVIAVGRNDLDNHDGFAIYVPVREHRRQASRRLRAGPGLNG
jgi:hypothetical protein